MASRPPSVRDGGGAAGQSDVGGDRDGRPRRRRLDINTLLNRAGKRLRPGESVTFTLVKGAETTSVAGDGHASALRFPRVAKFVDTVVPPDFSRGFARSRLYEEDVPRAAEEEDGDDAADDAVGSRLSAATATTSDGDGTRPSGGGGRRRRRWRRRDPPRRRWMLRREDDASFRYVGLPEHNPSHYVLLDAVDPTTTSTSGAPVLAVRGVAGFQSFSRPPDAAASLRELGEAAERERRRKRLRRPAAGASSSSASRREKLSGRLGDGGDDDRGVVANLEFDERGADREAVAAREELLAYVADEDVAVDGDGVLGGANDKDFGGNRRFNGYREAGDRGGDGGGGGSRRKARAGGTGGPAAAGAEAGAMADDFWARDVSKEYQELDYQPDFQNDDEDMGQTLIHAVADGGDGGGDRDLSDEDDEDDDEDDDPANNGGGLGSRRALKDFLGRGATPGQPPLPPGVGALPTPLPGGGVSPSPPGASPPGVGVGGVLPPGVGLAPPAVRPESGGPHPPSSSPVVRPKPAPAPPSQPKTTPDGPSSGGAGAGAGKTGPPSNDRDDKGQRIISIDNVRREIWLHNQKISLKKLGKLFNISSRNKERARKFKECLKELCTVVDDPTEGVKICKLKQKYSNMG